MRAILLLTLAATAAFCQPAIQGGGDRATARPRYYVENAALMEWRGAKPEAFDGIILRLTAALDRDDLKEAVKLSRDAMALTPSDPAPAFVGGRDRFQDCNFWRVGIAQLLEDDCQPAEAAKEYARVISDLPREREPEYGSLPRNEAMFRYSNALATAGMYTEAIKWGAEHMGWCDTGIELEDALRYVDQLIYAHAALGHDDAVRELLKISAGEFPIFMPRFVELAPIQRQVARSVAKFHLGMIYLRRGEKDKAIEDFRVAAEKNDYCFTVALAQRYLQRLTAK